LAADAQPYEPWKIRRPLGTLIKARAWDQRCANVSVVLARLSKSNWFGFMKTAQSSSLLFLPDEV